MTAGSTKRWLGHFGTYIALLVFMPSPMVAAFGIPSFLEFGACADATIEPNLDLNRYSGIWFTQEMVPNEYSVIASCSMTNYTWTGDLMSVVERGLSVEGRKLRQNSIIRPTGEGSDVGDLTVDMEGVPSAPFEVLATDYENYACVYSCMSFMGFRAAFSWVYTREPDSDHSYVVLCRDIFSEKGVDPTPLQPVKQGKDCPYMDKLPRVLAYSKSVQNKAKAKALERAKTLKVSTAETATETATERAAGNFDSTLIEEVQRLEEMEREIKDEEQILLQEMEEERQRQQEERRRMDEERHREQEERRRMEEERHREQEEMSRMEEERKIVEEERTKLEEERRKMEQERKEAKDEIMELRDDVRAEIRRNHRGSRQRSDHVTAKAGNGSSQLCNSSIATILLSISLATLMASSH